MGRSDERQRRRDDPEGRSAYARAFGRAIQVARAERGISRNDLADLTDLSYSYLAELEKGVKEPSSRVQQALARALGLPGSKLVELAEHYESTLAAEDEALLDASAPPPAGRRKKGRGRAAAEPEPPALAMRLGLGAAEPPPPAALRQLGVEGIAGGTWTSWLDRLTDPLQRDLERLRDRVDDLQGAISELRSQEAAGAARRQELENRITRWQDRLSDVDRTVARIDQRLKPLEGDVERREAERRSPSEGSD